MTDLFNFLKKKKFKKVSKICRDLLGTKDEVLSKEETKNLLLPSHENVCSILATSLKQCP